MTAGGISGQIRQSEPTGERARSPVELVDCLNPAGQEPKGIQPPPQFPVSADPGAIRNVRLVGANPRSDPTLQRAAKPNTHFRKTLPVFGTGVPTPDAVPRSLMASVVSPSRSNPTCRISPGHGQTRRCHPNATAVGSHVSYLLLRNTAPLSQQHS